MSSIDEIRDTRIKKLELLKKRGNEAYPAEAKRELSLAEAVILVGAGRPRFIGRDSLRMTFMRAPAM